MLFEIQHQQQVTKWFHVRICVQEAWFFPGGQKLKINFNSYRALLILQPRWLKFLIDYLLFRWSLLRMLTNIHYKFHVLQHLKFIVAHTS